MRPRIGVALGSGGEKGLAHIGVLKAFEEEGVPIDFMAGSSIGALAAALYGVGHDWRSMTALARAFSRRLILDWPPSKTGMISGRKAAAIIKAITRQKRFEDTRIPLAVVATDLISGERVVFTKGELYKAVRASISIPGIFQPLKMNGRLLVDGGVIDRVPSSVVREMGADIVIAVDVSGFAEKAVIRSFFDVIMRSIDIMQQQLVKLQEMSADIVIKPNVVDKQAKVYNDLDQLIKMGEESARRRLQDIRRLIDAWKER